MKEEKKLPKGWEWVEVGNLGQLLRGVSYKKEHSSNVSLSDYIPILRANNINGEINFEDLVFVDKKYVDEFQYIQKGDIIFAMSSGSKHLVGKSAQVKNDFNGSFGAFCAAFRPYEKHINKNLIAYFFQSPAYKKMISSIAKGTNINNLKREHIINFSFPLPPLAEQKRIVSKIDFLFTHLAKGEADLKAAQTQLKTYRQSVLKWAFEGKFTHKKVKDGELPKGWEWVKLGDIVEQVERIKIKEQNPNSDFIYIDIGSIDNTILKIVNYKRYKWKDAPSRAQQIIKHSDILFSTVRTYLKNIALVDKKNYDNQICSSGFTVIRADRNKILPTYLFFYVTSQKFINPLNKLQTGTSYPAVRDEDVFIQSISYPTSLAEQEKIVFEIEKRFRLCDEVSAHIKASLASSSLLRQSILEKAFSGELVSQDAREEPASVLVSKLRQARVKEAIHSKLSTKKNKL